MFFAGKRVTLTKAQYLSMMDTHYEVSPRFQEELVGAIRSRRRFDD